KARGGRIPHHFVPAQLVFSRRYKNGADVTDEERSRRSIFIATPRAAASWLFFHVARSLRPAPFFVPATGAPRSSRRTKMGRDARRSRLEKQPTDLRQKTCYFGDRTPVPRL